MQDSSPGEQSGENIVSASFNIGIVGAAGYTGGELLRMLLRHPHVNIVGAQSESQQGRLLAEVHEDLAGETDLRFSAETPRDVDALFLCSGHGKAKAFLSAHDLPEDTLIVDLSHDFRLDPGWVYGLPELNAERIRHSRRIANPGCFATAIQLALLPLAAAGALRDEVHAHAITGATGAGQTLQSTSHFAWRQNNLSVYKAFQHQHLAEILQSLRQLQPAWPGLLNFIPLRGDFSRGIFASLYTPCAWPQAELEERYAHFYQDAPFTVISPVNPHLKQVVNTNKCLLYVEKHGDKALIISLIDNLLKGASGQAVENMNLALGLEQDAGLRLKASFF